MSSLQEPPRSPEISQTPIGETVWIRKTRLSLRSRRKAVILCEAVLAPTSHFLSSWGLSAEVQKFIIYIYICIISKVITYSIIYIYVCIIICIYVYTQTLKVKPSSARAEADEIRIRSKTCGTKALLGWHHERHRGFRAV